MSDLEPGDFGGDNDMLGNLGSGNDQILGVQQQNDNDVNRMTSVTDNILGANAFGVHNDHYGNSQENTGFDYVGDNTNQAPS